MQILYMGIIGVVLVLLIIGIAVLMPKEDKNKNIPVPKISPEK